MFKLQYVAMKQFKSLLKQVHSSVHSLSESMVYKNYFFELPNSLLFSAIVGNVSRKNLIHAIYIMWLWISHPHIAQS